MTAEAIICIESWTLYSQQYTQKKFFDRYIALRKPCVIRGYTDVSVRMEDLVAAAGNETVQVEKRFSSEECFGQNRTTARQILMTVREFVEKISAGQKDGEMLYLSTQQYEPTEHEGYSNPFQTPCRQLLATKKIPDSLPWAGNLCLESCNLWMGLSKDGSSSGLHHDYHDNFYILLQGRKQFRLYSPDTAPYMDTHGTIERIHFNGLISYRGSETRADGKPVKDNVASASESAEDVDEQDEEEEVVLGKGYDYLSSEDEAEGADFDEDGEDDFDKIMGAAETEQSGDSHDAEGSDGGLSDSDAARPNSFSRIDIDNVPKSEGFQKCNQVVVDLSYGDVLYLPAGFFHCVTSFSSTGTDEDQIQMESKLKSKAKTTSTTLLPHAAINYWYHPPDRLESFQKPYSHPEDFSRSIPAQDQP
mmetsp:Transcript_5580/g.9957  ORF Transcript_5580/g.9957 Transcript_5580/m.9957 type:complete len:419 (+) Transcript_5580:387-1643(+)